MADETPPPAPERPGTAVPGRTTPVLRLRDVSVRFGKQDVLRGITLDILPHQTLCVIGESGCGKTVLLKLIVGLLHPTEGEVLFEGKSVGTMT